MTKQSSQYDKPPQIPYLERPRLGNYNPDESDERVRFMILSYFYFDIVTDFDIFLCILSNKTRFYDKTII